MNSTHGAPHIHTAQSHLRLTHLRRAVLDIVRSSGHPVTAYEILDLLRPLEPSATAAGIYRSLDFLTRNGLAHRLETTKAFVACSMPNHSHVSQFLVCRSCGLAIEAEDPALVAAVKALAEAKGFDVATGTIEISGLCRACAIK